MLNIQAKQIEQDQDLVKELMPLNPVQIEFDTDPDLINKMLDNFVEGDIEKKDFFLDNVLSEESRLLACRIEDKEYLCIGVFDPKLNIQMILPIKDINITFEPNKNFQLEEFSVTDRKLKIEYTQIIFGHKDNYFSSVNPLIHNAKFISKGEKAIIKSYGELLEEKPFNSIPDQFEDTKGIKFNIGLPLDRDSIFAQLHEEGHYLDLRIACNTVKVNGHFQMLLNMSRTGVFVFGSETFDPTILESLKRLKQAEIRGWLYANYFLNLMGNNRNLLESPECMESLRTYDRLLAHGVVNLDVDNLEEFFIFSQTIPEIRNWIKAFQSMTDRLKALEIYKHLKCDIPQLGVKVNLYSNSLTISGDDMDLTLDLRSHSQNPTVQWLDVIWNKIQNGTSTKKNYLFSLNKYSAVDEIGIDTFESWIEIIEKIKIFIDQNNQEASF